MAVKTLDVALPQPFSMLSIPPGNGTPPEVPDVTKLRLLMLDIDEVLTSMKTMVATRNMPHPTFSRTDTKKFESVTGMDSFDPHSIALINLLCETTGAFVVLSSSWRIGFNADQVKPMLKTIGIKGDFIMGRTPSLSSVRGAEIKSFISDIQGGPTSLRKMVDEGLLLSEFSGIENVKVESFAIVDDSTDMLEEQRPNLVRINGAEGFSLSDAIYTGRILSSDPGFGLSNLRPSIRLN